MSDMGVTIPDLLYSYASDTEPSNPEKGETWFDTDGENSYVWDGISWVDLTIASANELSDYPFGTGDLDFDPATQTELNNQSANELSDYPFGTGDLDFDPATQTELNNHIGQPQAHISMEYENISHTVTDGSSGTYQSLNLNSVMLLYLRIYCHMETDETGGTISVETSINDTSSTDMNYSVSADTYDNYSSVGNTKQTSPSAIEQPNGDFTLDLDYSMPGSGANSTTHDWEVAYLQL